MIPKVSPWKKDTVASLTDMLKKGGTVAVIDIHGVPAGVEEPLPTTTNNDS